MRRFLSGVVPLLCLIASVSSSHGEFETNVEQGGKLSLATTPVHKNYPAFFADGRIAPYRQPVHLLLEGAGTQGTTEIFFDLEANRVVVWQEKNGVILVYPWVTSFERYYEAFRRYKTRSIIVTGGRDPSGRAGAGGGAGFNIDIPVRFPKTLSRIIGQGANIQVSGSESITFSGETQYFINERPNEAGGQRKFPELDMRQQLQINLTGTIGEKVKVEVQHNSESTVPLENRIKLRYEGVEDEVIQKIEVGNTNLSLPGNQFVSFSSNQQGLFGVKAIGKAGKLDFTAILSQQQGRTDSESFTGNSREDSVVIKDMDFVKDRFFVVNSYDSIIDIRVFVDDANVTNNDGSQIQAQAFVDVDDESTAVAPAPGWYDELEESADYHINRDVGILTLNRGIQANHTLAVWYTEGSGEVGRVTAGSAIDSSVVDTLKLIRPPDQFYRPTNEKYGITWYYQLRNIYDLRARGILPDGFELRIFKRAAQDEERFDQQGELPYIRILGLDLEGAVPGEPPDDKVDVEYRGLGNKIHDKAGVPTGSFLPYSPTIMVDYQGGYLYFPDIRPFDPSYNHQLPDAQVESLAVPNPVIYDNHDPKTTDSKYEIEVKYRASQTSFSLNRSNIIEGSEVVKLNGRTLTRGSDYRIIYEIGQIDFLTDESSDPDAKISIDFEYAPFLSQAQKSLAGVAGTYNVSERTKLSTIWLYKGKKTPYRRPRLGQEPSRIVVGGLSLATERDAEFLTRLTDMIPGVTAREQSRFRVDLEAAATFPNPNTKNAIYIDDMEGTEEISTFGLTRRQWKHMSVPGSSNDPDIDWRQRYRNVWWYNPKNAVSRGDINPELSEEERIKFVPVLEMAMSGGPIEGGGVPDETNWGGIMRLVSKTGLDLRERKFFQIWVNDFNKDSGLLHVDMGVLGEDAMWSDEEPNGTLDTEDKNRDGVLDDTGTRGATDEDTGLDGLFNEEEPGDGEDPNGDDWAYDDTDPNNYSRINGTENSGFLDTEDLNGDGQVSNDFSFFRFTVDLSSDSFLAATGVQDATKNWRLYRIPLAKSDPRSISGDQPTFDKGVKYVRVWYENQDTTDAKLQIYSMEVTGNRWIEGGIQDSAGALIPVEEQDPFELFAAGVISNKSGEDYDPPPVEIIVERGVPEKEQSLVLDYENLRPGNTGTVFRALFDDEDYTRYEQIDFWAKRASPKSNFDPYPDFFFRFGGDSLNFYEVSTSFDSVPGNGWQQIMLDLAELTRIKLEEADTTMLYGRNVEVRRDTLVQSTPLGPRVFVYSAVGRPSMTKIRRLTYGVTNRSPDKLLTGTMWVDDLRLTEVKGDAGIAARVGMDVNFSDFMSISGDYRKVDKEFRRISGGGSAGIGGQGEENPRSGKDDTELNLTSQIKLGKFLEDASVALPVGVTYSKSQSLPELQTGSDIVLENPVEERTERKAETANIGLSRTRKSQSRWLYYTIDSMNLKWAGRRNSNFNPTKVDSSWSHSVNWSWSYSPRFNSSLKVFRSWKVNPLPTTGNISAVRERSENRSIDTRSESRKVVHGRKSNSSYSFGMSPVTSESFTSDFSFNAARDHLYGKPLSFAPSVNRGMETGRQHQSKLSYTPKFSAVLAWFKPRLSYTTKYQENTPIAQRRIDIDAETGDTLEVVVLHNVQNQNTSSIDFGVGVARIFEFLPTGKPAEGDTTGGGFGPSKLLGGIRSAGTRIGDITASVSFGRNSNYDRLRGRPDYKYQFGLTTEVDSLLQERVAGQTRTANKSRDITGRASSSLRLLPSMSMRISYNTSLQRSDQSRNKSEKRSTTWPDISYTWDGIDEIWRLEEWLKTASIEVTHNKRTEESGKSLSQIENERISSRWDPLLQLDFELINGIRSSISTDRSEETTRNYRGGASEKVSRSMGIQANFSYKISSRKRVNIPILGKGTKGGSFTATTNFSLDIRYDTSKEENVRPYRLDGHTRSISIRPRVTWTWLQNLSGGLELNFGERRNLKNENRSTRTIGASISALFKF